MDGNLRGDHSGTAGAVGRLEQTNEEGPTARPAGVWFKRCKDPFTRVSALVRDDKNRDHHGYHANESQEDGKVLYKALATDRQANSDIAYLQVSEPSVPKSCNTMGQESDSEENQEGLIRLKVLGNTDTI